MPIMEQNIKIALGIETRRFHVTVEESRGSVTKRASSLILSNIGPFVLGHKFTQGFEAFEKMFTFVSFFAYSMRINTRRPEETTAVVFSTT